MRRKSTQSVTAPPRNRCRGCGCTDQRDCADGCTWTDRTHTHCSRCYCARCGRKLFSHSWMYDDAGARVCRQIARIEKENAELQSSARRFESDGSI